MSFSMYELSIPVLQQGLSNLSGVVSKAKAHCEEKGIEESALLSFRFYPDMYTFAKQVKTATDMAVMAATRLAGQEPSLAADTQASFDGLLADISSAQSLLSTASVEQVNGSDGREISFTAMNTFTMSFPSGYLYLQKFILPNFYFHCTTAYDMLRHNGIALGKMDFLGDFGGTITPL